MVTPSPGYVKICGITRRVDAEIAIDAGATAIGLNLWPQSPRSLALADAAALADAVRDRIEIVTVCVDADAAWLAMVQQAIAPSRMQLHGVAATTTPAALHALFPTIFYAVGLADDADVAQALAMPGGWVLVDARDDLQRGGTGRGAPDALAAQVCRARPTLLAGGLRPDNVARAIATLAPAGVDVASGVESRPGIKDEHALRSFVAAARSAWSVGAPQP